MAIESFGRSGSYVTLWMSISHVLPQAHFDHPPRVEQGSMLLATPRLHRIESHPQCDTIRQVKLVANSCMI